MEKSPKMNYDKRHSSSTNGLSVYVEKQPVACKVCCMNYWCEKAKKYMSQLATVINPKLKLKTLLQNEKLAHRVKF